MTENNIQLNVDFIRKDKIVQHTVNGISRFLMLWIIMENGPIHGYRLMKELDIFFENLIEIGSLKKSSASKIYPILKDMENRGLVKSELHIRDNKKIKYYEITEAGEYLVHYIRNSFQVIRNTSQGLQFHDFLYNKE